MDIKTELKNVKRQFDNREIDKSEYDKLRNSLLSKWSNEPKNTEFSRGTTTPTCTSLLISRNVITVNKPKETDLYVVLQLKFNATETEIRSNYKKLALKHHPDKNNGIETEEWHKISKAYQILSDQNSRFLYDTYGTINDSLVHKASFNHYVGGDSWKPYIGDLEIGIWLFSFMDDGSLEKMNSAEQKEERHAIRVTSITRYLQDKLSQFPKKDSPEFEPFMKSLQQEAKKLSDEPNGKNLLSLLGEIYVSKAQNVFSMAAGLNKYSKLFDGIWFMKDLISGFLTIKTKRGINQKENSELIWRLSRSEISSIVHETCDEVLSSANDENDLVNSLRILGQVWLNVNKQSSDNSDLDNPFIGTQQLFDFMRSII